MTTRRARTARKPAARSVVAKSRSAKIKARRTTKPLVRKVIRRNPQKVAIKRKIHASRPVHKRVLLHPLTIMLILCVGVFVIGWTYRTVADSYNVVAEVLAPPLSSGATITSPVNGQTLSQTPIVVTGTCPANSIVAIQINNSFSGSAACGSSGTFQIQTDIYTGDNTIIAQDYNVTGQAGPTASNVTAAYVPATPVSPSSTPTTSVGSSLNSSSSTPESGSTATTSSSQPLQLTSSFHYETFTVGSTFNWQMDLAGGTPPYTVNVTWGDGETTKYTFDSDPVFSITHKYSKPGFYAIKVLSQDAAGAAHMLQVQAVINQPGTALPFGPTSGITTKAIPEAGVQSFLDNSKNWLWVAWPSLIVVSLMVFSFMLGEHQEARQLFNKKNGRFAHR